MAPKKTTDQTHTQQVKLVKAHISTQHCQREFQDIILINGVCETGESVAQYIARFETNDQAL